MKLLSFDGTDGERRTGMLVNGRIADVSAQLAAMQIPADRRAQLQSRGIAVAAGGLARWLQAGPDARISPHAALATLDLASVRLRAPVERPGKIVGVGRNYADHAKETGVKPFEKPRIIFKVPSSVGAPGGTAVKPQAVQKMDFEGELAVVIGDFARDVPADRALDHVAGYTLLNDLSAREFQFDISPPQTTFAKSMDGFCPMGPWLVTSDEIPDPQQLDLETKVNGCVVQHASTRDMLFPVRVLISYVSQYMTLEPGDVIATGTPAGIGAFRTPPQWLARGDVVEISITNLGTLRTTIG